jgi:hypothetical protein
MILKPSQTFEDFEEAARRKSLRTKQGFGCADVRRSKCADSFRGIQMLLKRRSLMRLVEFTSHDLRFWIFWIHCH